MKALLVMVALLLTASGAIAQEPTCATEIQTANGIISELRQQVALMSGRAAEVVGRLNVLGAELATVQVEVERLNTQESESQ